MTEMRSVWLRLEAVSVSVEECWAEAGWRAGANSWFSSDQAAAPRPHQISPQATSRQTIISMFITTMSCWFI